MLVSHNPATGEIVATYQLMSDTEIDTHIQTAYTTFTQWRKYDFTQRSVLMFRLAHLLRQHKQEAATMMTMEMGKPITQALAEIEKCAWCCEYFAQNAEQMLASESIPTEYSKSQVHLQPMGVVFAIMPWNFPYWQVFRCLAPTIMSGNTIVLKHSPEVTGCAMLIQDIVHRAGFPTGTFTILRASVQQSANIIAHPTISAVTLTGSTHAGKAVAAIAGAHCKKCVLELGGSDPYLILDDADIEQSADICVNARIVNSGQSCVAAKRFIVMESVRKKFEHYFVEKIRAKIVGNPFDTSVHIGPLARIDIRDTLQHQASESIRCGAVCLLNGGSTGVGAYFLPMVLTNVQPGMPAYQEELFGPVAAIISVTTEQEAIHVANDSIYGLGSAVFTNDASRGERIALALDVGICVVNDFVKSDPRLPFGGVKNSGFGRELSAFGIREFVNVKTVCEA